MPELPRPVLAWRREDALRFLTRGQIQARTASGTWQVPFRGVYAAGDVVPTPEQWALAAVLASTPRGESLESEGRPRAAAFLRSAARVWGLPLINDSDPALGAEEEFIHNVVSGRKLGTMAPRAGESHHIVRHKCEVLTSELTRLPSGLWVTTPLRTALDCARLLTPDAAVCLLDQGLRRRLFTSRQLWEEVERMPKRPGRRQALTCVQLADGRAESVAETLARLLLLPLIPGLTPQVKVRNERGHVVARLDLGDEEVGLAVETDGKRWHAGQQMAAKDHARDRVTERLGWRTERVTWVDLRRRPDEVAERIMERYYQLCVIRAARAA